MAEPSSSLRLVALAQTSPKQQTEIGSDLHDLVTQESTIREAGYYIGHVALTLGPDVYSSHSQIDYEAKASRLGTSNTSSDEAYYAMSEQQQGSMRYVGELAVRSDQIVRVTTTELKSGKPTTVIIDGAPVFSAWSASTIPTVASRRLGEAFARMLALYEGQPVVTILPSGTDKFTQQRVEEAGLRKLCDGRIEMRPSSDISEDPRNTWIDSEGVYAVYGNSGNWSGIQGLLKLHNMARDSRLESTTIDISRQNP